MARAWKSIGERIAKARRDAGMTQHELSQAVGLDRTAVSKLERGQRKLDAMELMAIAQAVHRSVDWLLEIGGPGAVPSHRGRGAGDTLVEARADTLARDVGLLIRLGVLEPPSPLARAGEVAGPADAERTARDVRQQTGIHGDPIPDLAAFGERLGLYTVCEQLGSGLPEGCYMALEDAGVVLLNGSLPSGRQRFTLAHEIGHHVLQDEYSVDWSVLGDAESERIVNAFAVHLLLPADGLKPRWTGLVQRGLDVRSRAIIVAAEYGASWTATVPQLARLGLLDEAERAMLSEPGVSPRRGDYEELEVSVPEKLPSPMVSPKLRAAVLRAYRSRKVTAGRALELLRGTLTADDLPLLPDLPMDGLWADIG
ncbi:MAG: helix-turn-helix domain-containing protein [Myxococcota bacterium]